MENNNQNHNNSPLRDVKKIEINSLEDVRGSVYFIEDKECEFQFKRFYYLYWKDAGDKRGAHAHLKLKQIFICFNGKVKVELTDKNNLTNSFILNHPGEALIIPPMLWRDVTSISKNSIMGVLASNHYDKHDYIRDIDLFLGR